MTIEVDLSNLPPQASFARVSSTPLTTYEIEYPEDESFEEIPDSSAVDGARIATARVKITPHTNGVPDGSR